MITSSGAPRIWQRGAATGSLGVKPKPPQTKGVWGRSPQRPTNFYGFHTNTLILAHFFIEKGHAVSTVTWDNAKIFSPFLSKSRSLAKMCQRRLQPLLVLRNYRLKVKF